MRQAQGAAQREEVSFMDQPLWRPSPAAIADSNMAKFRARVARDCSVELPDTDALWRWSVDDIERFWLTLWRFCGVIGETGAVALEGPRQDAGRAVLPRRRGSTSPRTCCAFRRGGEGDAIVFWGEDKVKRRLVLCRAARPRSRGSRRRLRALRAEAGRPRRRLHAEHARGGDRRCSPPRASARIWSSCSPDFGVQGVLDRFGQIEPKVLFAADGYYYGGKTHRLARAASPRSSAQAAERAARSSSFPYTQRRAGLSTACRTRDAAGTIRWRPYRRRTIDFERAAVRPSALHHVFLAARPACRNASCTARAARCCST